MRNPRIGGGGTVEEYWSRIFEMEATETLWGKACAQTDHPTRKLLSSRKLSSNPTINRSISITN